MALLLTLADAGVIASESNAGRPNPPAAASGSEQPAHPWKPAKATVFWVGEAESPENGYIANHKSAWDVNWEENFGGVDAPNDRCGYRPCAFTPRENAFYVALPYDDMTEGGPRKKNTSFIPWDDPNATKSVLKNRWIAVRVNDRTCYGQWQDVGPFETDDAAYVFGTARTPKNKIGVAAGIDISPAMRDCLGVGGLAQVEWRHVEASEVPPGPWKDVITTRPGP